MEPLRRFRMMAVRAALALTGLGALGAYAFDRRVALGVMMGGIGGVLGFWLIARWAEKLANPDGNKVKSAAYKWTGVRLLIYGLVLGRAYLLDPEGFRGFWGAVGGLLIIRAVVLVLGVTGLDLKPEERPDRTGPDSSG